MSPPVSKKRSSSSSAPTKKSSKSTSKRSASAALSDSGTDSRSGGHGAKRSKRSASGKKSLREEELGVGEIEEEDEDQQEDGDGDEDGGDGGVTRCVCGDDNEDMSSGLMIQCDTCKCWQHGPCVGLWEEKECPNRYFCELCKPNLHGPGGLLRKVPRKSSGRSHSPPATATATATSTASTSTSAAAQPKPSHPPSHKPRESADSAMTHAFLSETSRLSPPAHAHSNPPKSTSSKPAAVAPPAKKRSTMNSRDAAYDDAIALSILEAGSAALRKKVEKARGGEVSSSSASEAEEEEDKPEGGEEGESAEEEEEEKRRGKKVGKVGGGGKKGKAGGGKKGKATARRSRSKDDDPVDAVEKLDPSPPQRKDKRKEDSVKAEDGEDETAGLTQDGGEPPNKKRRVSPAALGVDGEDGHKAPDSTDGTRGVRANLDIARSPSPASAVLPIDTIPAASLAAVPIAVPVPHVPPPRGKHPNQYTYRPKPSAPATSASTNGQAPIASGSRSPTKRPLPVSQLSDSGVDFVTAEDGYLGGTAGEGGDDHASLLSWHLPEHLLPLLSSHSRSLLPTPTPLPIQTPQGPQLPTRVRWPSKRATLSEMRKRVGVIEGFVGDVEEDWERRRVGRGESLVRAGRVRDFREWKRGERVREMNGEKEGAGMAFEPQVPRGVGGTTPVGSTRSTPVPASAAAAPSAGTAEFSMLPPLPGVGTGGGSSTSASAAVATTATLGGPERQSTQMIRDLLGEVARFKEQFYGVLPSLAAGSTGMSAMAGLD